MIRNAQVPIELDKTRHIRFDFNAFVAFEEVTGKSLLNPGAMDNLSLKDIRVLLWAGLVHEDPELTIEAVGAMIHPGNLPDVMAAFTGAQEVAAPKAQEGGSSPPQ